MPRKQDYIKIFFRKVQLLIDKEDVKNTWNEGANIGYVTIKAAVYYLLNDGLASTSDIREALNKAFKDYDKDYP
jgi:hypothetical protein